MTIESADVDQPHQFHFFLARFYLYNYDET
jgi:hypothetical protein